MTSGDITARAKRGAFWSLIIAGFAFPLNYVRVWMLDQIGNEVIVGTLALIILLVNGVNTFFFPGGRNVLPTFYPKIEDAGARARLVTGYLYLVALGAAVGTAIVAIWPGVLDILLQQSLPRAATGVFQFIVPVILVSVFLCSLVMAQGTFIWAALLNRTQLICVTSLIVVMYVFRCETFEENVELWLGGAVAVAATVSLVIGAFLALRRLRWTWRGALPAGLPGFAAYSYLDTVLVYVYTTIDQWFVVLHFGKDQLGIYFLLLSVSRAVPLFVQELGHLLLATFSRLLGTRADDELCAAYARVSRLVVLVFGGLLLVVLFFARPIALMFGPAYAEHHDWLIMLVVFMNVESIRMLNSMTLMAYERMRAVALAKVAQIVVQGGLTVWLIQSHGIHGVIVAKGAGHVVNIAILAWSVARLRQRAPMLPPRAYYVGVLVVAVAGWVSYAYVGSSIGMAALGVVIGVAVLWSLGGYNRGDLRAALSGFTRRRGERAE